MIDYHRQDDKSPPPLREPECYCFEVTQQIKTIMVNHVCFPDDGTLSVGDGFDFTATNTGQRFELAEMFAKVMDFEDDEDGN